MAAAGQSVCLPALQKQGREARGPGGPPGWGRHRREAGGVRSAEELCLLLSCVLALPGWLGHDSRGEGERGRACLDNYEATGAYEARAQMSARLMVPRGGRGVRAKPADCEPHGGRAASAASARVMRSRCCCGGSETPVAET